MDPIAIHALLQPQAYPEQTSQVNLIQTHVSLLFVTDTRVYKVKKAVNLGFLNFSTLDRRRFYCEEEVRLNRRLCPDIYLGVAEIRHSPEGPSFNGNGRIIDYAVKMVRLPEENMLHRLLADNRLGGDEMRRVARKVAAFHQDAETNPRIASYGSISTLRQNWEENFNQLIPFEGAVLPTHHIKTVRVWVEQFLDSELPLLEERVRSGCIRDCDGDLHLENICLTDEVCIFDCIEFNERFRYSDTAADIAFLLMDLDFHGATELGRQFLDEYVTITKDLGALPLLPFYKIYRSVVRSKVEAFRLNDPAIPEAEKAAAREKAAGYLRLARQYVVRNRIPRAVIITCGLMGTGKSTVAEALARETGIDVASSDRVRKELAQIPLDQRCSYNYGEGIYNQQADRATYSALLHKTKEALSSERSIIIDASFRKESDRAAFRSVAAHHEARFFIIFMECGEDTVRQRLEQRSHQGRSISDGRWELFALQKSQFEMPCNDEGCLIFIDTSRDISVTIDTILEKMGLI